MSQLDKTFPTLDCSACILTPKMVEAAVPMRRLHIYTYSEVEKVSGFVGDFTCGDPQESQKRGYEQVYGLWRLPGEMSEQKGSPASSTGDSEYT